MERLPDPKEQVHRIMSLLTSLEDERRALREEIARARSAYDQFVARLDAAAHQPPPPQQYQQPPSDPRYAATPFDRPLTGPQEALKHQAQGEGEDAKRQAMQRLYV